MSFFHPAGKELGEVELDLGRAHLTVLPNFSVPDENLPQLRRLFHSIVNWFPTFSIVPGIAMELGEAVKVPVVLVAGKEDPTILQELHCSLAAAVQRTSGYFRDPEFVEEGFLPHVSHWASPEETRLQDLTLTAHTEGFGQGVRNLANYRLNGSFPLSLACPLSPPAL